MQDTDQTMHVFKRLCATVFYGTCSILMTLINKTVMTTYNFNFPVMIMLFQMVFTIFILNFFKFLGLITFPSYNMKQLKQFMAPSLFYSLNSVLALSSLSHMNLAMYGVLKRCVPLVTMLLSVVVLKRGCPSKITVFSILCLTAGCIIAGYGDLRFDIKGYIYGCLSNLMHAMYLLLFQKQMEGEMSTTEVLQLNSINSLPLLLLLATVNQEVKDILKFKSFTDINFIFLFLLVISIGCLLNYSLFLCTNLTSALTTCVVGGIKSMVQTFFGFFMFGGISMNLLTYLGIGMNLFGNILYIVVKYKEANVNVISHIKKVVSLSTIKDFHNSPFNSNDPEPHRNNEICLSNC